MSPELEQKLEEKYAFMRKGKSLAEQHSEGYVGDLYSAFGCECDDGWFELLDELCAGIQKVYEEKGIPVDVHVAQIKEKYGTLRFYASVGGSEEIRKLVWDLISDAEHKSEFICEECGKPGTLREGAWITVKCDECYAK